VINQTSDTLQNLTLELSTIGDLKLVERPPPVTLLAQEQKMFKANIKVSSTETGSFLIYFLLFYFIFQFFIFIFLLIF
jgi:vesicle coat complex subunit